MSIILAVPPPREHNLAARRLFLSMLDQEWPGLQKALAKTVWPSYRRCWRDDSDNRPQSEKEFVQLAESGRIWLQFPDGRLFTASTSILWWSALRRLRDAPYARVRDALEAWAEKAGKGLKDEWFMDAALSKLRCADPACDHVDLADMPWTDESIYSRLGLKFGPIFEFPFWRPDKESPDHFNRRMRKELDRELTAYRKQVLENLGLSKGNYPVYARWTIARLSGLSWTQVSKDPVAKRYTVPVTQVKKRVREFAAEIGLTLIVRTQPSRQVEIVVDDVNR